ncbi:hypothetical protein REPUB_Repub04eG0068200 [Reevesia pubescens]
MIGRLCSGRPITGHGQYDFEGWVERKCSSCLNCQVNSLPPHPMEKVPLVVVLVEETQQEIKEEEHEQAQVQGQKQHGSSSDS